MAEHQNSQSVEVVAQDADFDISESTALTQPYSQNEIEDLLYSAELSVEDRITRLRAIRDEMVVRESGDFGEQDPADMISELDRAIEELLLDTENADETGEATVMAADPADHLDALSPDDVEARAALIGEEEFYDEDEDGPADDDHSWHGSDEFKPDLN